MSADGGHFEPRSGSLNTILEVDHLRTIDDMFALNWLTGFIREDFKTFPSVDIVLTLDPMGNMLKNLLL
jgi:hypothetical protein